MHLARLPRVPACCAPHARAAGGKLPVVRCVCARGTRDGPAAAVGGAPAGARGRRGGRAAARRHARGAPGGAERAVRGAAGQAAGQVDAGVGGCAGEGEMADAVGGQRPEQRQRNMPLTGRPGRMLLMNLRSPNSLDVRHGLALTMARVANVCNPF
eukprot:82187-Chlamydomonas_euryale.AAC.2